MLLEIVQKNVNKESKNKVLIRLDDLVFDHITKNISFHRYLPIQKEALSSGFVPVIQSRHKDKCHWFLSKVLASSYNNKKAEFV